MVEVEGRRPAGSRSLWLGWWVGVPLPGRLAIPLHRLALVLGDASAVVVHDAEIVLSFGVPLLRGLLEPLHRLGVVLAAHAQAVGVPGRMPRLLAFQIVEHTLGVGVSLIGGLA